MSQTQAIVAFRADADRRALDLKAGTGAQFTREAGVEPAGEAAAAQHLAKAEFICEGRLGFFQAVEIIGDGEMLGDIALPWRHAAAIGLDPIRHARGPLEKRASLRPTFPGFRFIAMAGTHESLRLWLRDLPGLATLLPSQEQREQTTCPDQNHRAGHYRAGRRSRFWRSGRAMCCPVSPGRPTRSMVLGSPTRRSGSARPSPIAAPRHRSEPSGAPPRHTTKWSTTRAA